LGMHRVYNSAFMNMLRDEKNVEYRQLIKNTLEFDPQILKRYVNFMNNPDERTAADQYGKGDKYFGICTMLATMPGLPMFGHGQVEGYTEKYGMEYRKAYWNELPDPYLVQRHEHQIFPLLHRRYVFAEVDNFLLYDFFVPEGHVDENVFAYSNRRNNHRALVLYHNKYAETRGYVRYSAAYAVKDAAGEKHLVQRTLAEGLNLPDRDDVYIIFRDTVTDLEYIRNAHTLCTHGLYAELHAYQVHVFVDFREIHDNEWRQYAQLAEFLNGRGVPSVEEALKELFLAPVHEPFRMLVSAPAFRWLIAARVKAGEVLDPGVLAQVEQKMLDVLHAVEHVTRSGSESSVNTIEAIASDVRDQLEVALSLSARLTSVDPDDQVYADAVSYILNGLQTDDPAIWGTLLGLLFTRPLGKVVDPVNFTEVSRSWLDEWLLGKLIANALQDMALDEAEAWYAVTAIKMLISYCHWFEQEERMDISVSKSPLAYRILHTALQQQDVQTYLGLNRYQGILWFNKEAFEQWLWWLMLFRTLGLVGEDKPAVEMAADFTTFYGLIEQLLAAAENSGYQVARLLEIVSA